MTKRPRSRSATDRKLKKLLDEAERDRRQQAAILLKKYLTVDAAFVEQDDEKLLREACEDLDPFDEDEIDDVYDNIMDAIPLPETVAELWVEYDRWQQLYDDRTTFRPDYGMPDGIHYRMEILEDQLDKVPARSFDDLMARLNWMAAIVKDDKMRDFKESLALIERLREDVTAMYMHFTGG